MSSVENINKKFNKLINIYQGVIPPENNMMDPLKELIALAIEHGNNYLNFCSIIIQHLKGDDTRIKSVLFNIIDSLFKRDEIGELYVRQLSSHLYTYFKECFTVGDFEERVLLFKIFYTWKYIIPKNIFELIYKEEKLDDFAKVFEKYYPGKLNKYDIYNENIKIKLQNNISNNININAINKNIIQAQNQESEMLNSNIDDKLDSNKKPKKIKKLLKKKIKSSHKNSENDDISNIPQKKLNISNPNILFSMNEYNLYVSLVQYKTISLKKNIPIFNAISQYYNDIIKQENNIRKINNYEDIRKKMKQKLFDETNKNKCYCGFKTLYYNNLIKHLDVHFNFNFLKLEGKNLFRKKGNNKTEWIKEKNINTNMDDNSMIECTLNNLIFYKNMMYNNNVKMDEKKEEVNEEYMYPVNDNDNKDEICYYCGDKFKKIFSGKYNYWFYNKVVLVIDDKNKYLSHQECYEELAKKNK